VFNKVYPGFAHGTWQIGNDDALYWIDDVVGLLPKVGKQEVSQFGTPKKEVGQLKPGVGVPTSNEWERAKTKKDNQERTYGNDNRERTYGDHDGKRILKRGSEADQGSGIAEKAAFDWGAESEHEQMDGLAEYSVQEKPTEKEESASTEQFIFA
jgi:hypothetical protein